MALIMLSALMIERKINTNKWHFIYVIVVIFIISYLLSLNTFFEKSVLIEEKFSILLKNIFLMLLFFITLFFNEVIQALKNNFYKTVTIGCSCTVGRKNYWTLILSSLAVLFFSQTIVLLYCKNSFLIDAVIVIFVAYLLRYSFLKHIEGYLEIIKSLFYSLITVIASQLYISS
jgi:hypothetical protein